MRVDELAKGWLLALVEDAPLDEVAGHDRRDLVRDGPRICDAVVRAVCDEGDLRRIEPEGVLEPLVSRTGELAGAATVEAAARAVETLRNVVWSALRAELSLGDPDLLADTAERLSLVAEQVRGAVLRRRIEVPGDGLTASVRVDHGGEAPWIDTLRDEIVTAGRVHSPLSLLLVELEDADRLVAVEPHDDATATFARFARAVRILVRRRDVFACESECRAWIIAPDTDRAGAEALGTRIATAVPAEESWRGAPLTVSVGVAVLAEDGDNAAALIDTAEQTRFAAQASGIGIVTGVAGEGGSEPPSPGPSLAS